MGTRTWTRQAATYNCRSTVLTYLNLKWDKILTDSEDVVEAADLVEEIVVEVVVSVEIVVDPEVSVVVIAADPEVSVEETEEAQEDLEVVAEEVTVVDSEEVTVEVSVEVIVVDSVEETEEASVGASEEVPEEPSEALSEERELKMPQYTVKSRTDSSCGYFTKKPRQLKKPKQQSLDSIHDTPDHLVLEQTL